MGIYDRQIKVAKRLISQKGQLVVWRSFVDGVKTLDWIPTIPTYNDYNVSIVFLPHTRMFMEFLRYMKGTDIPVGSLVGLMSAVNFVPSIRDIIVRPNDILTIKAISPLAPNGDIIFYTLELEQ
jgi:hypothetical protein